MKLWNINNISYIINDRLPRIPQTLSQNRPGNKTIFDNCGKLAHKENLNIYDY